MTDTRLSCYEFGRRLLETNDLDPVYVVLHEAKLDPTDLEAWLLAYWCFYHVGTASWITDEETRGSGHSYWEAMMQAARSKEYPRSPERRHFRGENAISSVTWLEESGLQLLFAPFSTEQDETLKLSQVTDWVKTWVGFGPWIAFKVADMIDSLGLACVVFDDAGVMLFDSPRDGAQLLFHHEHPNEPVWHADKSGPWAIKRILDELGDIFAPPHYKRLIGPAEAETILCKWKSYMGGRYEIGEDIEAVRRGLLRFAKTPTAQVLLRAGKTAGLWK